MKKINVIHACWLDLKEDSNSWCEYCLNTKSKKTYLPFHSNVINGERICENCVKDKLEGLSIEFSIINFFPTSIEYKEELNKLDN
jgi:superfamily II helicase